MAQLLYNRGILEPSEVEPFLKVDDRLLNDPWLLPDMAKATSRIYQALLSSEKITIYGDFDADGLTGTAILVKGLSELGANVTPYIPERLKDGHGLTYEVLRELHKSGTTLVISVDCGIGAQSEVAQAREDDLDIIITDHHLPIGKLPQALAVIDPKRADSEYPFEGLSGAGVAFKLIQALYHSLGKTLHPTLLETVALGTIADMVPLTGENRYLVKKGLEQLNINPSPGIRELISQAGLKPGEVGSSEAAWALTPRLNAASRLEDAMLGYQLLVTDSIDEARKLVSSIEEMNTERQRLTREALVASREEVLSYGLTPVLIATSDKYPPGILGLVASRLTDEFYRPSVVISIGEEESRGSCRSIPEFDLMQALNRTSSLLSRFGGHSQAAGFSLPNKNLESFKEALLNIANEKLKGLPLLPKIDIDAEISFKELGSTGFKTFESLSPFGIGNPHPVFLTRGVLVGEARPMGNGGKYLALKLKQSGITWNGALFDNDISQEIKEGSLYDMVYSIESSYWQGEERLRLIIKDSEG